MTFTPTDRATWPELLMRPEVALILRRGEAAIDRDCWRRVMVPAPYLRRPLRWRKADVIRFLDGAQPAARLTRSA